MPPLDPSPPHQAWQRFMLYERLWRVHVVAGFLCAAMVVAGGLAERFWLMVLPLFLMALSTTALMAASHCPFCHRSVGVFKFPRPGRNCPRCGRTVDPPPAG